MSGGKNAVMAILHGCNDGLAHDFDGGDGCAECEETVEEYCRALEQIALHHAKELDRLRDKAKRFLGWRVKATDEGCYPAIGLAAARRIAKQWRAMGRPAQIVRVYRRAAPGTVGRGRG